VACAGAGHRLGGPRAGHRRAHHRYAKRQLKGQRSSPSPDGCGVEGLTVGQLTGVVWRAPVVLSAGTGSEVTQWATIWDYQHRQKYSARVSRRLAGGLRGWIWI
jgi:hypothetical protein